MKILPVVVAVLAAGLAVCAHGQDCPAPERIASIDVPGHPFSALADASGCWLFVSVSTRPHAGSVVVLHSGPGGFAVDHAVPVQDVAYGEALSRDGGTLAVAGGGRTTVLDVLRLEHRGADPVLAVLTGWLESGAIYAAISPDDRLLVVSDERSSRISVFDLARARTAQGHALLGHIPVTGAPVGLAFSADGRWLYATSELGTAAMTPVCKPEQSGERMHPEGLLFRIDVAKAAVDPAHAVTGALPVGCNPVRVAVAPSGRQLWVTARGDNALVRVGLDSWLPGHAGDAASFPVGTSPVGVAVRPDGRQVWVALSSRFDKHGAGGLAGLTDLSSSQGMKLMTAPARGFPRELSFLPDGRTLVATLFDAQRVEFVPTPPE